MAKKKEEAPANNVLAETIAALQATGNDALAIRLLADYVTQPAKTATPEEVEDERRAAQQIMQDTWTRQRQEQHYWITFNKMGENDNVDTVDIGAAGVMYHVRKGHRVPLPQSAINVMKDAVRVGWDHGRPIMKDGRRYLRQIRESEYSYVIEGPCSPEEAQEFRNQQAAELKHSQDLLPVGRDVNDGDLLEIGSI